MAHELDQNRHVVLGRDVEQRSEFQAGVVGIFKTARHRALHKTHSCGKFRLGLLAAQLPYLANDFVACPRPHENIAVFLPPEFLAQPKIDFVGYVAHGVWPRCHLRKSVNSSPVSLSIVTGEDIASRSSAILSASIIA